MFKDLLREARTGIEPMSTDLRKLESATHHCLEQLKQKVS